MRYYRVNEDWITHLDGELAETLRGLDLARLQKYPPPKLTGMPVGNESRVLSRFLKGESSQLDASAVSTIYRSLMSDEERLLYRAFRENADLSYDNWSRIIGEQNVERWRTHHFLFQKENGELKCQFSVVSIDGLVFCVDPIKDHGNSWERDFLTDAKSNGSSDVQPFYHTYIGLDSLGMIEKMEAAIKAGSRYLDCGTGAGGLLLYFARRFYEAIGLDINPRAVKLAQFNAELNDLMQCKTHHEDATALGEKFGRFDLVSWNMPFVFLPDDAKDESVDGFGGEMGIGLCLKFVESIPDLLSDDGMACLAVLSPILDDGTYLLESELTRSLDRLKLDCEIHVGQLSLSPTRELWQFHRSNGVKRFEAVHLFLKPGIGKLKRIEPSASRRVIDAVREKIYARKFA